MSEVNGVNNSEILFIYEAKLCNPNGDPNGDNKPRIDPVTQRNYVTDVRLKRFIRDYIADTKGPENIYVTSVDGEAVTAEARLQKTKKENQSYMDALKSFIDVRLFGALLPVKDKGKKKKGAEQGENQGNGAGQEEKQGNGEKSEYLVGPVQFSPGYSLHRVELMNELSQITSQFVGKQKNKDTQHGTFGRDWRVYYSLIAFYGCVNSKRAEKTGLTREDVSGLDSWTWESLVKESLTRSKIGHYPHLYLRVEYSDGVYLQDLRRFIQEDMASDNVRSLDDVNVGFGELLEALKKASSHIARVYVRESPEFAERFGLTKVLEEALGNKVVRL